MLTIISDWGECYGNEKSGPSRTYRERGLFARTRSVSDGSGRASGGWESSAVCTRQRESIGVDRDGVSFVQSLWINTGSLDENATRLRFGPIAITAEKDQCRSHCSRLDSIGIIPCPRKPSCRHPWSSGRRQPHRLQLPDACGIVENHVSRLFGDHDGGCVGVAGSDGWHDRCVNHA